MELKCFGELVSTGEILILSESKDSCLLSTPVCQLHIIARQLDLVGRLVDKRQESSNNLTHDHLLPPRRQS